MSLRESWQHRFNPLHVYCRLRDIKCPKPMARRVSAAWEMVFNRPLLSVVVMVLMVLASCAGTAQAKHLHKERVYQEAWCAKQEGTLEVRVPGGLRIDCETTTHAVEVDFASKWAEAIGQSVAYAGATGKRAGILLIIEKPSDERHLAKLRQAIGAGGLSIDIWTITPDEVAQ